MSVASKGSHVADVSAGSPCPRDVGRGRPAISARFDNETERRDDRSAPDVADNETQRFNELESCFGVPEYEMARVIIGTDSEEVTEDGCDIMPWGSGNGSRRRSRTDSLIMK